MTHKRLNILLVATIILTASLSVYAADVGIINGGIAVSAGATIDEFSTDGTLAGDSDTVVPTEKAVKTYVDGAVPAAAPATYDASVAASGADYTSIVTACATEAAGARIFVVSGTYNETADIVMKDGQMLIGQNPEDTIIDFGAANRKITPDGAGSNRAVMDLTVQGSIANYTIEMNGQFDRVKNCRIIGTSSAFTGVYMNCLSGIIEDCSISGFTKVGTYYGIEVNAQYVTVYGNRITDCGRGIKSASQALISNNQLDDIDAFQLLTGNIDLVVGNIFYGNAPIQINGIRSSILNNFIYGDILWSSTQDLIRIVGNHIFLGTISVTNVNVCDCIITGNIFEDGQGIEWGGSDSAISGNTFEGSAHLQWNATATTNTATGNNFNGSTEQPPTRITDLGVFGNFAMNNLGVSMPNEKYYLAMQNLSGSGLTAGDVVVINAAAPGNQITLTTAQGDPFVIGVVSETINNGFLGFIQTLGKITTLKVNGTVDIAIGDFLGTYTSAGIAMKAASGDMAFAIALEAYTPNDSSGVIDALLVTPRLLP